MVKPTGNEKEEIQKEIQKAIDQKKSSPEYISRSTDLNNLGAIRSAISLYFADTKGKFPPSLNDLVPKFLKNVPEGNWNYNPQTGDVSHPDYPGK